ncbi:unnamed protein product [Pedinophyceae sp. YPF-701]|nr:unnamed protein product [Pedinophyceae sp. YPF-701]
MSGPPQEQLLPKKVGQGYGAYALKPLNPQDYLAGSHHPYAPFPGQPLRWQSYVYDDGTTYEGLMRENIPHGRGVLTVGKGGKGGGGLRGQFEDKGLLAGDKYEGEFLAGYATGFGQFSSDDGTIYRGEWMGGRKNGCGVLSDLKPFFAKVAKGKDPRKAWKESKDEIEASSVYGTWRNDQLVAGPDETGRLCSMGEILGTVEEVDEVVTRSRMFRFKPDGEVSVRYITDGKGTPVDLMQDPLAYPHGTGYLMPGPAGQAYSVPQDKGLRKQMVRAAENHQAIWNMYNVPYDPRPGSVADKALKAYKKKEKELAAIRKREEERLALRTRRRNEARGTGQGGDAGRADDEDDEDDDDDDVDDDDDEDLLSGGPKDSPPVASITMGLSRAALAVHRAFERAAQHVQRLPRHRR